MHGAWFLEVAQHQLVFYTTGRRKDEADVL